MLPIYGEKMPLRLLEEVVFWKTQEMEHTVVIRELVPRLEPVYVRLLQDWEAAFARTLEQAQALLRTGLALPNCSLPPEAAARLPALVEDARCQSREFIRQLNLLQGASAAVRSLPVAPTVLAHIRRESEYFLGVVDELAKSGAFPWMRAAADPDEADPDEDARQTRPGSTWSDPAGAAEASVPIGGHTLPPLPYPYNALEPYIDEKTMRLHHDKHHRSYVEGLNKAEKKLEEARKTGNFELVKHWERELAFHGAGHYLHTIFWDVMSPGGGSVPSGPLADRIARDFGSFDAFMRQFSEAADKVEGGGWAILVWSPRSRRLEILTAEKHQNLSQWDVVPILPLDVWEHAYYLKHQNDRKGYIQDWWNVVNWPAAAERYAKASRLQWQPF